ncbi:MAG: N-acetylmuramoyl-L-alanine amidase [Ignavibacteria bacterium]|nr:N-acetylmuramoyl-L-alanine amidase [Ignavibacteria bacterium]
MNQLNLFLYTILFSIFILTNSFAENTEPEKDVFTVILDPGHGGKDPGTTGTTGVYEKNINLSIALKVKEYLAEKYDDIRIILTREKDEFIELKERGKIANENNGDLFVSIHCNYKKKEEHDKNGFEIYISDLNRTNEAEEITKLENKFFLLPKSDTSSVFWKEYTTIAVPLLQNVYFKMSEYFATILELELTKGTVLESRGIQQEGYFVLIGASMPVLLVECGFLSNVGDERYLKSQKGQNDVAKAIYKAIVFYKMDYDYMKFVNKISK